MREADAALAFLAWMLVAMRNDVGDIRLNNFCGSRAANRADNRSLARQSRITNAVIRCLPMYSSYKESPGRAGAFNTLQEKPRGKGGDLTL